MQQILKFVNIGFAKEPEIFKKWISILNDKKNEVGIIFNERLINVPIQLAPPLHRIFFEEVNNFGKQIKSAYPFLCNYFLLLTKTFTASGLKKNKKMKTNEEMEEYFKEEERIYRRHAELEISFPMEFMDQSTRWTFQSDINQFKVFLVIKSDKIPQILKEIDQHIKIG